MESDNELRERACAEWERRFRTGAPCDFYTSTGTELELRCARLGLSRRYADPFGDAVKAAQDRPEPSAGYTPERFSDNKDFDADKAWRETMGSSW
jgi:hypothetical protein